MRRDSREGCRRLCPHRQPRIHTRPAMSWPDLPDTNLCFHQGSPESCCCPNRSPQSHTRKSRESFWPDPPGSNPDNPESYRRPCRHPIPHSHKCRDASCPDLPGTNPRFHPDSPESYCCPNRPPPPRIRTAREPSCSDLPDINPHNPTRCRRPYRCRPPRNHTHQAMFSPDRQGIYPSRSRSNQYTHSILRPAQTRQIYNPIDSSWLSPVT